MLAQLKETYSRYERHISTGALLAGFIFDNLTLRRIDLFFEQVTLFVYLGLVIFSITILTFLEEREIEQSWFRTHFLSHLVLQFAFGGLFSAFFIFYFRSAAVAVSWPFLLFLTLLLIGNELFKRHYQGFTFRMAIFYVTIFSFLIFFLPVVFKTIGVFIFLASGFASLVAIYLFYKFLSWIARDLAERSMWPLIITVLFIWGLLNIFYFTNIIPPAPLSLKESRVAHGIIEQGGSFVLSAEPRPWYAGIIGKDVIRLLPGESASMFTAIFAPAKLSTDIIHVWQYYNEASNKWETVSTVRFNILGGRGNGYRLYSTKSNLLEGRYRVNVETLRGALVGRVTFRVLHVSEKPSLETVAY